MENTVDDFFNEINQIAPPKTSHSSTCDWQECFDNSSGYSYYWNMKTDQVTWSMPPEYKLWKSQCTPNKKENISNNKSVLFPNVLPANNKVNDSQIEPQVSVVNKQSCEDKQKVPKNNSSNNHEKVTLIPAYGEGSDSESECEEDIKNGTVVINSESKDNHSSKNNSDDENIDIITKLQSQAKILKDLGGELPPDVKKIVEQNDCTLEQKPANMVAGFALLAGYGESDEEDEEPKTIDSPSASNKVAASTLFPIPKPIDLKQFLDTEKPSEPQEEIDTKAFHRKRRIGIDFKVDKPKTETTDVETDRQGLGFKADGGDLSLKSKVNYPGFKSAGVLFVKNDVATSDDTTDKNEAKEDLNENDAATMKKIEETHKMLNEKLTFLSEGREPVSPVQAIIIQMETLYAAMQARSLTLDYLYKWLKQTCSELVKLEKDAAPCGWLLQWDRINKRYYYRNQQTGESQWEFPQPDIIGGDEAMDICTTPPPSASETLLEEPPPPPRIKTPTPPPPPTISRSLKQRKRSSVKSPQTLSSGQIELPSLSADSYSPLGEPLPPGVDSPPEAFQDKKTNDALGSELDSFYSDIAALETNTNSVTSSTDTTTNAESCQVNTEIPVKRKKKSKVKLVEGLAMKKKGVSKLVERWKNVQKDL